jgi:hypothetical protein
MRQSHLLLLHYDCEKVALGAVQLPELIRHWSLIPSNVFKSQIARRRYQHVSRTCHCEEWGVDYGGDDDFEDEYGVFAKD